MQRRRSDFRSRRPEISAVGGKTRGRAGRPAALTGLISLCVVLTATVTPADAASTTPRTVSGPGIAVPVLDGSLIAGYVAKPSEGLASASFRFKVPTVNCTGGEAQSVSIGLGDVQDLQAPRVRAHVVLACPSGGPAQYSLAVQACSQSAGPLPTKHGHRVSVALAQSGGMITVTATDEKDGTTISAADDTANCDPPDAIDSVLFGAFPVFAPTLLEVPKFNKVKPEDSTVNGVDLSGERVDRQTKPGIKTTELSKTLNGSLSGTAKPSGDSFYLKYRGVVHCCLTSTRYPGAMPHAS